MIKVYDRVNNKSNHTYLAVCLFNTNEIFSGEDWLKQNHREVYDSYESAIDAYTQGHAGACIESCRTCLVIIDKLPQIRYFLLTLSERSIKIIIVSPESFNMSCNFHVAYTISVLKLFLYLLHPTGILNI